MPTNVATASSSDSARSKKRKEDGNRLFANKLYSAAVACYREGLDELPSSSCNKEASSSGHPSHSSSQDDKRDEIINLEVGLRSNIALALLRLADEQQSSQLSSNNATNNNNTKLRVMYKEIERECNIAIQLDAMNPKLYYRRGLARQGLAEMLQRSSSGGDYEELERLVEEQLHLAEQDLKRSSEINFKQMTDKKQMKAAERDSVKAMQNLQLTRKKIQSAMKDQRNSSLEQHQSVDTKFTDGTTVPPPSPQVQRDYILELLSRCTPHQDIAKGEAYFLVNMDWWQSWCRYVDLFSLYTIGGEERRNNGRSSSNQMMNEIKQHCQEIDASNRQILQLLPPGATLPPYLEQNRSEMLRVGKDEKKKKKGNADSDSSSTSSEEEEDDDEYNVSATMKKRPGVIDNSSLILPSNNEGWCCAIESIHNEQNQGDSGDGKETTPVLLRNNLVRGYHYELLPREAYVALRKWYGESSTHILRRVIVDPEAAAAAAGGGNKNPRVELYSEHWDIISRRSSSLSRSNSATSNCSACGSPEAIKKCRSCGVVSYCNRSCQVNHWSYHKKSCPTLKMQREQGGLEAYSSSYDSRWGRVGLNNLGNTCFLNSAMQCMVHVAPLTRYFLSGRYSADINTHNILGTGGKVANAYSDVLKDLWMGSNQYRQVSPTALKRAIELFAPQFSGASQQDSAELITYLLDALHEDLNRVKKPPYIEIPDVDLGRKLSISGAEAWQLSCLRNDSFVYDNFYGLYKSKCVCPLCNKVTVKFDPFNHITLEIPQQPLKHIVVLLIRDCAETGAELPIKYCVSLPSEATIYNLKERFCQVSGVPLSRLAFVEVDFEKHMCIDIYNDKLPISAIPHDTIVVAYEAASFDDKTEIHCTVNHVAVDSNLVDVGGMNRRDFGIPIFLSFHASLSCAEIYDKILTYVVSFAKNSSGPISKETLKTNLSISVKLQEGLLTLSYTNETLPSILGNVCTDSIVSLTLEWKDMVYFGPSGTNKAQIHWTNFTSTACHPSYLEQEKKLGSSDPSSVSLYECFESFTQPERLDDENMLYCSGCKKHVQAMKTVTFWRLPKIMVVHLKRFEYKGAFNRSKISVLVDFPLDGLDLDSHSPQSVSGGDFVDDRVPMIYDLFGVVNHYGRMGYGHYTAHARRWDETGAENAWAEFDDESVTDVANADSIVSPAAYVLFYKRRLFL